MQAASAALLCKAVLLSGSLQTVNHRIITYRINSVWKHHQQRCCHATFWRYLQTSFLQRLCEKSRLVRQTSLICLDSAHNIYIYPTLGLDKLTEARLFSQVLVLWRRSSRSLGDSHCRAARRRGFWEWQHLRFRDNVVTIHHDVVQ